MRTGPEILRVDVAEVDRIAGEAGRRYAFSLREKVAEGRMRVRAYATASARQSHRPSPAACGTLSRGERRAKLATPRG